MSAPPPDSRPADRSRSRQIHAWALALVVALALAVGALLLFTEFDWHDLTDAIQRLNAPLLIVLMCVLPLTGFSITIFYVVAGARFGPLLGGALVAGATAFHLAASHAIARSILRRPMTRLLERYHRHWPRIPPGENAAISVMIALVPGPPYFARNYLLALNGIPLGTYFWICLPIYVARSYVALFAGDLTQTPNGQALVVLIVVYVVKLSVCAYIIFRLRRRYKLAKKPKHPPPSTPTEDERHGLHQDSGRRDDGHASR